MLTENKNIITKEKENFRTPETIAPRGQNPYLTRLSGISQRLRNLISLKFLFSIVLCEKANFCQNFCSFLLFFGKRNYYAELIQAFYALGVILVFSKFSPRLREIYGGEVSYWVLF